MTVSGGVCVLFNGRNGGGEWCVGFEGLCCFVSAFASVAGDKHLRVLI